MGDTNERAKDRVKDREFNKLCDHEECQVEFVCRWDLGISISLSARVSWRRSIGNSKEMVYGEGRSAGVPGSSADGGSDGLKGSALLCGLGMFLVKLL